MSSHVLSIRVHRYLIEFSTLFILPNLRKRNREHAKKSRMRKKQFHEDLLVSMSLLQDENEELRSFIRQHLGDDEANRVPSSDNLQKMRVNEESLHKAKDTTIKAQVKKDAERDLKYKTESETLALRDSVRQCEAKIRSLESQLSLSESHLAKAVAETEVSIITSPIT